MILAGVCFAVMAGCVKIARLDMATIDIILWRSLIAVPASYLAVRLSPGRRFSITNKPILAVRIIFGMAAMTCFFTAAKGLPIADLSIITRVQPIMIALIAPLLLGHSERVHPKIWLMLIAGVGGCAILLAPELAVGSLWGLWALGAMFFSGFAHIAVRRLGATETHSAIVFWFQIGVAIISLVIVVSSTQAWPITPPSHLWPHLVSIGLLATLGQLLMTRAYALDKAGVVSGAANVTPLWAAIVDVIVFSHIISGEALIGGALIIGASVGLIIKRRNPDPTPELFPSQ